MAKGQRKNPRMNSRKKSHANKKRYKLTLLFGGDDISTYCHNDNLKGKWDIVQELGKGVQGRVYEIHKRDSKKIYKYAIKLYSKHRSVDEGTLSKKAGDLGIGAKIYDHGNCGHGYAYIIFERLHEIPDISAMKCKDIIDILRLYQKLLTNGIIQKDLKPANIMVDDKGYFRIVDYGMASSTHKLSPKKLYTELYSATTYFLDSLSLINYSLATKCKPKIKTWLENFKQSLNLK